MDIINTNDALASYTSAVEINHYRSDYMYFIQTFCSLPLSCLLCWSIHIFTEPMKQNVQLILEMCVVSSDFVTLIDHFFSFAATAPQWARASSFTRFLDHTQRHTTFGRTPLDE